MIKAEGPKIPLLHQTLDNAFFSVPNHNDRQSRLSDNGHAALPTAFASNVSETGFAYLGASFRQWPSRRVAYPDGMWVITKNKS